MVNIGCCFYPSCRTYALVFHSSWTSICFLLRMIITTVGFTICCCSVIHFFSITITSSLLSQPHLIAPSQPCLYTYHPNPLYHLHHHHHVYTSPHCTAIVFRIYLLIFTFWFYILHLHCTHILFYPDWRPVRTKLNLYHFLFFPDMHFIFQGLVLKWLYPSVHGQGVS